MLKLSLQKSYLKLYSLKLIKSNLCQSSNSLDKLPPNVKNYIIEKANITQPSKIHICDGSNEENQFLINQMLEEGSLKRLKLKNCYLALTDPRDVARVEFRTVICTSNQLNTIPTPRKGFYPSQEKSIRNLKSSKLGNWISIDDLNYELNKRLPGCMKGRTMYVIAFSMGPLNSPFSKIGIELTDSPYVVCSMRIMTRIGKEVLEQLQEEKKSEFVKCLHSVGVPLPTERKIINNWPCNPEETMISHLPEKNEIISYGSGYGGNSLLGKKCFALRIGSILARNEGWLAEHMLILGVTNPKGIKKYMAAAFPSACGKTNLAMLTPSLPGWKVECVGDDIAWMRFDQDGILRAINPENGFFGVAPGTSYKTNPIAMETIKENTIFTNTAMTNDGDIYWEGINRDDLHSKQIISWKKKLWLSDSNESAAHPNSRFCAPASQCPIIDTNWQDPRGVPIEAIIFGGRRPEGVPLVFEALNWKHGVFLGASMRSESTSAAEHTAKQIMNDPFAMRPFFGYNFGDYLAHWLSMEKPERKLPKIFHVNWFLERNNQFIWPGFGDNIRVLEWIFSRIESNSSQTAKETPIGYVPTKNSIKLEDLDLNSEIKKELFKIDKGFWSRELDEIKAYFDENVNDSMPQEIYEQLQKIKLRLL